MSAEAYEDDLLDAMREDERAREFIARAKTDNADDDLMFYDDSECEIIRDDGKIVGAWVECRVWVSAGDDDSSAFRPYAGTTFGRPDRCRCGAVATRQELNETGEPIGTYCDAHDSNTAWPKEPA